MPRNLIQEQVQEIQEPFQKGKEVQELLKKGQKSSPLSQKPIPKYQVPCRKEGS